MDGRDDFESPAETLRSLSDAKRQLEEMQQELKDAKERSQSESRHRSSCWASRELVELIERVIARRSPRFAHVLSPPWVL